jgi:chorismate synthase
VTNGEDLRVSIYEAHRDAHEAIALGRSQDDESPAVSSGATCARSGRRRHREAMVALVLADALLEKFGGDSIDELRANWQAGRDRTAARFTVRSSG